MDNNLIINTKRIIRENDSVRIETYRLFSNGNVHERTVDIDVKKDGIGNAIGYIKEGELITQINDEIKPFKPQYLEIHFQIDGNLTSNNLEIYG